MTVTTNQWSPGAVETATDETDAADGEIHTKVEQTVTAPRLTLNYLVMVDGDVYVQAQVRMKLGELVASTIYGPPPSRTGA